ncbi:MAG: TetR/AcrR family transcriptional regulator [Clostridiaceae bacterium]
MDDIRKRILDSAKVLFFSQGYNKTTIRQIVDKSGIRIGSIYYFFKNKEEIFKSLVLEIFDMCDKLVNERFGEDESPVFRYAFMCALELHAVEMNEKICELFFEGYTSNTIMEEVVKHTAERTQTLFKAYNPNLTYEDYYARTLAIKGIMRSYIANRYLKQGIPIAQRTDVFLDTSLHALNVKQTEIEQVKIRISNMSNRLTKMALLLGAKSLSG